MRAHPTSQVLVLWLAVFPACGDTEFGDEDKDDTESGELDEDDGVPVDDITPRIFGAFSSWNCLSSEITLISDSVRLGEWLTETPEFARCVLEAGYGACDDDDQPYLGSGLQVSSSDNDYHVTCDSLPGGADGTAAIDAWGNTGAEEIALDIDFLTTQLGVRPLAGQAAVGGVLWRELMHQHGFENGNSSSTDPATAAAENRAACGQTGAWMWNAHSMPYLMGNCFSNTALGITRARLSSITRSEPTLTRLTNLVEISLGMGGILDATHFSATYFALNWRVNLRAQHSLKCIGVAGGSGADHALVQQSTCTLGDQAQRWYVMPVYGTPILNQPRYIIMNAGSGKCLDRPWGNVANHTVLQQYTCHGGAPQQFRRRATGQYEALTSSGNGLSNQCLDIADASSATGATLQMSTCKPANSPTIANQVFDSVL